MTRFTVPLLIGLSGLAPAAAAQPDPAACSAALTILEAELTLTQLPGRELLERIERRCDADTATTVKEAVGELQIVVLTSQVQHLDAERAESYDALKRSLGQVGAGKATSLRQAFGVVLGVLQPVLRQHLDDHRS